MRARDHGRAYGRILALGAALAVVCSAATGTAGAQPSAEQQQQQRVLKIVVVGDSYSSGEGIHVIDPAGERPEGNSYIDARDPRHQSTLSAAAQAAARLQEANPGVQVELSIVASSGATTTDVFNTQRKDPLEPTPGNRPQDGADMRTWYDSNDMAVNFPQISQIPADADAVIVGLGGNDAFFGPLVEAYVYDYAVKAGQLRNQANKLLDSTQPDQVYRDQAKGIPGRAPTLVARLLQVVQAIKDRAPGAKVILQTYPVAVDPEKWSAGDMLRQRDMVAMRDFATQLNNAIKHAAKVCGCASVADVSQALQGRELNTPDPGINSVFTGLWGDATQWSKNEPVHPNVKGAGLMADPLAQALAGDLGLTAPQPRKDRQTDTSKIRLKHTPAPDTDNDGVADYLDKDWDGDGVPNTKDRKPNTPDAPGSGQQSSPQPGAGSTPPAVIVPPRPIPQSAPGQRDPAPLQPIDQRGTDSRPRPIPISDNPGSRRPDTGPQPPASPTPTQTAQPPTRPLPPRQPTPPQPTPQPAAPPPQSAPPRTGSEPPRQPIPPQTAQPPTGPQSPRQPAPPRSAAPPAQSSQPAVNPPSGSGRKPKGGAASRQAVPSATMRSPKMPSVPKPPSTPKFDPNFGPKGSPGASQLGGGLLGVTPPPPPTVPGLTPPPGSKTPLGGGKPAGTATPPLPSRAPAPPGGAGTPPLPSRAPTPPPAHPALTS
ncbi:GDSL-type esterase/lipase family protein [Kibdelosporangium persicum]|uniref:SGNH hydrolase-type esterase domain-containing protein n=1 Tax=Kibdelosporangium persicum TaxID=2698649 RepID=A0ABX2F5A1_9PSEU|nr:GDSL-type esterase/lipase family protein [Kibdelosporangium persicum]NRN66536.1 hypothetical protein [Kibdelosporangium persicum]